MTCGVKLNWKTLVRAIYKLSKYKKDKRDERDEAMAFLIMILQFPKRIRFNHIRDNFIKQLNQIPNLLLLTSSKTIWCTHGDLSSVIMEGKFNPNLTKKS